MKEKIALLALAGLLVGAVGCSNEDEAPEAGLVPAAAPQPPPTAAQRSGQPLGKHLRAVDADLKAKNYKAAADRMRLLGQTPKTAEEDRAYRQALYDTHEALRQQAENDAAAREAYQRFGARMMGR